MKILIEESVLQQALDALDTFGDHTSDEQCPVCEAVTDLRTALDAAEKIKPVAWAAYGEFGSIADVSLCDDNGYTLPLYPHPAPTNADSEPS